MKKNTASQVIGAQMCSATDGSNFTGSVTVYVTGDGGTQAAGSVGAGACTHEGKGFHTYAPAQAETNYDHVAFTFEGTGAVTATIQVYPSFPQTGDNYARLGAPAGASLSADIAGVQSDTNDIQTRLPAALGANGNMKADVRDYNGTAGTFAAGRPEVNASHAAGTAWNSGAIGASTLAADTITAAKIAPDAIGASELAADAVTEIQSGLATAAVLATVAGYLDTEIAAILAVTNALPNGGALTTIQADLDDIQTRLPTALTGAGNIKADMLAVNGSTSAAALLAILNGSNVVYQGTVTGAATTTTLIDSGLTQADTDWWKGRIIIFTSVLTLQATDITAFDPALDKLTFTATTQAPTGATFVII